MSFKPGSEHPAKSSESVAEYHLQVEIQRCITLAFELKFIEPDQQQPLRPSVAVDPPIQES